MTKYTKLLAQLFAFPQTMTKKQHLAYANTLLKMSEYVSGKTKITYIKSIKKHTRLGKK